MADQSIFVNGKQWDWGNIQLTMLNGLVTLVTKISFEESRESVNNYGIGQYPVGYGNKNVQYKASLEMYSDQLYQIAKASPGKKIWMIPPFSAKIIMSGDGVDYATFKLMNCRFTSANFDAKQNDSSILVPVPIVFAGLINS